MWRIPAEVFLRLSTGTPVSDVVKFNMADLVHRLSLTASRRSKRHHFENTNLLAGNNHVIDIFTSEDMGNIHCVLYNKW